MNKMRPIHPGEILRVEMEELNISANRLAEALHVPANRITFILNRQRNISADTAFRFSKYFRTTPEFWINLQIAYDLRKAQIENGAKIGRIEQ